MKKEYVSPSVKVCHLDLTAGLLQANSKTADHQEDTGDANEGNPPDINAKASGGNFSVWDE